MSVNSLLFPNNLRLNGGTINLSATESGGNPVPPIVSPSTELCANIYVQRAVTCDNAANVSSVTPLNITNMVVLDYILKGQSGNTAHWVPNTPQPAASLLSDTTTINVSFASAPSSGQVLTATSSTTANWQTPSGGGGGSGNITSNAFTITNDPVTNYILTGIDSDNASWQIQGKVADSFHADWADTANVFTGKAVDSFHADWADTANVFTGKAVDSIHADWSDTANVFTGKAVDSIHADWADTANVFTGKAVDSIHADWADTANTIATTFTASGALHYPTIVPNTTGNQDLLVSSNIALVPSTGEIRSIKSYFSNPTQQIWLGPTGARITAASSASVRDVTIHDTGANSNFVLDTGGALTITDTPAGANEVLVSSSSSAATWETSTPLADVATQVTNTISTSSSIHYLTYVASSASGTQSILTASNFAMIPSNGQLRIPLAFLYSGTQQLWLGTTGARFTASSGATVRDITIPNIGTNSNMPLSTNLGTAGQVLTNVGSGYGSWQALPGNAADRSYNDGTQSTTSQTYVDATNSVTLTTGTKVLVCISGSLTNDTLNRGISVNFRVSGATTIAAQDSQELYYIPETAGRYNSAGSSNVVTVTPGSNTFTLQFQRISSSGTATMRRTQISVIPLN